MEYLSEPKVKLVTRTTVNWDQVAAFLEDEDLPPIPDSIRSGQDESSAVVEISARLCYMSFGKGRKDIADFINNLLSSKDGSVLEHVNYGFVITGVSRSLTHELVRHRAGFAYSQRSQRYVNESDCSFVLPPALVSNDSKFISIRKKLEKTLKEASANYDALVNDLESVVPGELFESKTDWRKAIRQAARSVLPNATETKICVTANVRSWRHFIEMRAASFADWEIRCLAIMILQELQTESPLLFGDFSIENLGDGTKVATPLYSKV